MSRANVAVLGGIVASMMCSSALASKDVVLTHDADLIAAVSGAGKSCSAYALRKGAEAPGVQEARKAGNSDERRNAWRRVTFQRYFEECIAEAARELAESRDFDQEKGKDALQELDPLYRYGGAPKHVDATASMVTASTVRFDGTTMPLRDLLTLAWKGTWKDLVIDQVDGVGKQWCLLHFGYASGLRIHVRAADGSWPEAVLNAGAGEKGIALSINQCLSGDPLEDSSERDESTRK